MEVQTKVDKQCLYHPDIEGIAFCEKCGGYICRGCIIKTDEKQKCKKCNNDKLEWTSYEHKNDALRNVIGKNKYDKLQYLVDLVYQSDISSIRSVVANIISIINNPQSNARDLKNVIQIDPPLTAKVLRTANSAYYASRRKISEIEQAVIWIGYNAVKEIALNQKVCEIFDSYESKCNFSRISLWKHSIAVALLGRMIYRREFGVRGEDTYVAGLLHDIGIIAEDQFLQQDFKHILNRSEKENKNLTSVEYEVLGFNHADLGMAITNTWNLSHEFVVAIGYHHNPEEVPKKYIKIAFTLYVADYICQEHEIGFGDAPIKDKHFFQRALNVLNIKPQALDLIMKDLKKELSKMEDLGVFENGKH